jgi:hypothetical protein
MEDLFLFPSALCHSSRARIFGGLGRKKSMTDVLKLKEKETEKTVRELENTVFLHLEQLHGIQGCVIIGCYE